MKKQLVLGAMAVLFSLGTAFAQNENSKMKMQTAEERTTSTIEKMAPLALNADQAAKVKTIITNFYNAQQKGMEEMRASGNMDREAMKVKNEELSKLRDAELKTVLTEAQYTKWMDEIAPSLRRRGGGPKPGAN